MQCPWPNRRAWPDDWKCCDYPARMRKPTRSESAKFEHEIMSFPFRIIMIIIHAYHKQSFKFFVQLCTNIFKSGLQTRRIYTGMLPYSAGPNTVPSDGCLSPDLDRRQPRSRNVSYSSWRLALHCPHRGWHDRRREIYRRPVSVLCPCTLSAWIVGIRKLAQYIFRNTHLHTNLRNSHHFELFYMFSLITNDFALRSTCRTDYPSTIGRSAEDSVFYTALRILVDEIFVLVTKTSLQTEFR